MRGGRGLEMDTVQKMAGTLCCPVTQFLYVKTNFVIFYITKTYQMFL